ncbi:MAG: 2-hydroxy-acid oxidase [Roseovarius sp. BRH_c41]|uniref:glycolate oxidase subunit GlcE n=1 Tax=Roseovarius sp. BRH_c41 TaxID=1629709 RepID=UPI0005F1A5F7|nr:glycolate oxidase subunit GlcE [Roseovarius sp. BRH_c41]KJS41585.1 MAG: 2-hydroxy-acid oxidase [Roseovarius sp. BRH_c41]
MTPNTEADLAEIIRGAEGPLRIEGGGTRPIGALSNGARLSTSALCGIELYEPGALTLVARAGTPLSEIEAALEAEGQRLAFEPMDHRGLLGTSGTPTIGGVVAANVSGPRRIQAGACRDFLLGVRFVDGRGQIVKNGGRVMKNVTGYDLVKLMAGSFGTLGVLTEVALKVLPRPRSMGMLRIEGLSDAAAVAALCRSLASPYEVTGAAHLQEGPDGTSLTMIRLEGFENSVAYRAEALTRLLAEFGACSFEADTDKTASEWAYIRDVGPFQKQAGNVWRLSVKPTDAPGIVADLPGARAFYDWGGGLIWLLAAEGSGLSAARIRSAVAARGGHATLIRGDCSQGAFPPLPAPVAALQEGLRFKFDPRQILNPGLMATSAAV